MMSNGPRARRTAPKQGNGSANSSADSNRHTSSMSSSMASADNINGVNGGGHISSQSISAASIPSASMPMNGSITSANGNITTTTNNNKAIINRPPSQARPRLRRKRKTRREPPPIPVARIIVCALIFLFAACLGWIIASSLFLGSSSYSDGGGLLVSNERSFDGGNNNNDNLEDAPFSILVVGGSDGSGTRAFCWALKQLGVVMLVDDRHTMDIEASQLFDRNGWPGFVKYVLQETHGSLDYQWEDLSFDAQKVLKHEVGRFIKHLKLVYENMKIRIKHAELKEGNGGQSIAIPIKAQRIHFAIKAPASMLVLPVLKHVFEQELKFPVSFLHVVRDGRDVSLSQNQSPAQKFYNATFPEDYLQRIDRWKDDLYNVRAMQLWNNWNLQVWTNHHRHGSENYDQIPSQQLYDKKYLLVRSEDLVHTKWEVMQALHQFVDSSMPLKDLCCQSHQKDKDLGESVHFADTSKHHHMMNPHRKLRRGRHGWGGFKGNDGLGDAGAEKPPLDLFGWVKESDKALEKERNRDPRAAIDDGTSNSYSLEDLLDKGVPLLKQYIKDRQGNTVVKKLESLVQASRAKLDKDYKEWKQKFVTRNRSSDAEEQTTYLSRTGNALLDQARSLQHARLALFSKREEIKTEGDYSRPSDKVVKDIIQDLIKRLHMLDDSVVEHAFTRGQGGAEEGRSDGYVDQAVLEKRYGKWQGLLAKKPELSIHLHEEGWAALDFFGYEPYQDFVYPELDYQCTQEQLVQCSPE